MHVEFFFQFDLSSDLNFSHWKTSNIFETGIIFKIDSITNHRIFCRGLQNSDLKTRSSPWKKLLLKPLDGRDRALLRHLRLVLVASLVAVDGLTRALKKYSNTELDPKTNKENVVVKKHETRVYSSAVDRCFHCCLIHSQVNPASI